LEKESVVLLEKESGRQLTDKPVISHRRRADWAVNRHWWEPVVSMAATL
jgi:hypothetical protein